LPVICLYVLDETDALPARPLGGVLRPAWNSARTIRGRSSITKLAANARSLPAQRFATLELNAPV
jgi:hypothetical protein